MANVKKLLSALSRRGPHKVLAGPMQVAGIPGRIYTPETGTELPAIAFGHSWMTQSGNFPTTLEHLASWGIVAACPDTERGPVPSDTALAHDLSTALSIISQIRLGSGAITVHPHRLGVVGVGFGASASVLTASGDGRVKALCAIAPAPASPGVLPAAGKVQVPALILATPGALNTVSANAVPLHEALGSEKKALRVVAKSTSQPLVEGTRIRRFALGQSTSRSADRTTRALLTGFLLGVLGEDKAYSEFADPDSALGKVGSIDPATVAGDGLDPVSRLLRA